MVSRILAPFYRLHQDSGFPPPNFDAQHPDQSGALNLNVSVRSDAHTALAREIAGASTVLLKNINANGARAGNAGGVGGKALPLRSAFNGSVAVVGMDAKMPEDGCNQNECNEGVMVIGCVPFCFTSTRADDNGRWGSGSYSLANVVPPIDSLTTQITSSGGTVSSSLTNDVTAGVAAARGKDVAIVCVNAMSGELGFYDVVDGNMGDRNDMQIWFGGSDLVTAVAGVNSNTIVVIHSVGPVVYVFFRVLFVLEY